MILATLSTSAGSAAAVEDSGSWYAIDGASDLSALLSDPDWRRRAGHSVRGTALSPHAADFLNPLPRPQKIFCCGLNYRDHIVETGRDIPEFPTLFAKYADTLTGPTTDIEIHASERVDWEAELAVVVGTELFRADRDRAAAGILGYTASNDVSMRDWQSRTLQWLQGKAWDATTPLGPVIVTADAIDPVAGLRITSSVNEEVVQDSDTAQLVFDSAHLVSYISQFTRLRAGDVILTGTPGGVGMGMTPPRYLQDGDVLVTSIEGIGTLRNRVSIRA